MGSPEQNPAAAEAENAAAAPLDPEVRAEVELVLADAREQIIGQGREPTLSEVVQQAMQARKDLPESAFRQVAVEVLAGQGDAAGEKAREAVGREIARRLRIRPEIRQAMEEAFVAVLNEFRDATLQKSAVLESVGRQVHGVTGGQMREFAQRLREAAPRPLTEDQIIAWADAYHRREGQWPRVASGDIPDAKGEVWANVNAALEQGLRGLPGGSSLARLLKDQLGVRNMSELPPLTIERILAWADAHHARTGRWPQSERDGPIPEAPGETWKGVQMAMVKGRRGFPGGASLPQLLAEHRGARNHYRLPALSVAKILEWADSYRVRTGRWPTEVSGIVEEAPEETWGRINTALREGIRGLPSGSSLPRLLAEECGKRNHLSLPDLTEEQILAWADAHWERSGTWPTVATGAVQDSPGDTWLAISHALARGTRGFRAGSSLAQLLAQRRGKRNHLDLPGLSIDQVLAWTDAHHARTGKWPKAKSGLILEAIGETWAGVDQALRSGNRGLAGRSSLAQLLNSFRGIRNRHSLPSLTEEQIVAWADAHCNRTGKWPNCNAGPVDGTHGETWAAVEAAVRKGTRGLPGGSTLARLIQLHCRTLREEEGRHRSC